MAGRREGKGGENEESGFLENDRNEYYNCLMVKVVHNMSTNENKANTKMCRNDLE